MNSDNNQESMNSTEPNESKTKKGKPKWVIYLTAVFGLIYLLNPTFGFLEILPDNIPFIGNIDEGVAAIALWNGILELKRSMRNR